MMMMGNGNSPSWAEIRLARLREEEKIDLYPKQEVDLIQPFLETSLEYYALREEADANERHRNVFNSAVDYLNEVALTESIYQIVVGPVLEENYCSNKDHVLSRELIYNFIHENGVNDLLRTFKYTNVYLAEVALITEDIIDQIKDLNKDQILSQDQLDNLEMNIGREVSNKIYDKNAILPKDITK